LPAMDMEVTDVRYEGTLIPQVGRCAEHCCSLYPYWNRWHPFVAMRSSTLASACVGLW
jgi:hypothetical protein